MSRFVMQMKQINQFQREKSKNIDFSAPVTIITGRVERKKLAGRPRAPSASSPDLIRAVRPRPSVHQPPAWLGDADKTESVRGDDNATFLGYTLDSFEATEHTKSES